MDKVKINYFIDILLVISFIVSNNEPNIIFLSSKWSKTSRVSHILGYDKTHMGRDTLYIWFFHACFIIGSYNIAFQVANNNVKNNI